MNIYHAMNVPTPTGPDPASPHEDAHFCWSFDWKLFARMLNASRRTRGWTLRQAGDALGVAPATLLRMEQGKNADMASVVTACEFMGLMLDAFVSRPGQPDGHFGEKEESSEAS